MCVPAAPAGWTSPATYSAAFTATTSLAPCWPLSRNRCRRADCAAGGQGAPLVPFAEAERTMGSMARSFWADNRKVRSETTQRVLGRRWLFPSYREGLRAILAADQAQHSAAQQQ